MKVFVFGALVAVAAASYGDTASGESYVQRIKQRNSHMSHPPVAHNPPLPELYAAASQTHFTQLYGGPSQDSYSQLYGGARQPAPSRGSGGYGRPEPEEDDDTYQPGYGRPAQPPRPPPAYPPQVPSTRRPDSYHRPAKTTTTRRPVGSGSYQNAVEDDDDDVPSPGYGRPAQPQRPPTTRRPISYPVPTRPTTTTTRRPPVGYPQPSTDDYEPPVPGYPQPPRRPVTTGRPVSYPKPTIRTTTTRRPTGGYPGGEHDEIETPGYHRPSRITPPPPVYPQPTTKRPGSGAYGNDLDDIDPDVYTRPRPVVKPPPVVQRPTGGYPSTDLEEVEQAGYGRPQVVQPTHWPVQKQPTGGYPSTDLEEVEQGGYGGPARPQPTSETQQRPLPVLPPRKTPTYPSANELPNPSAAARVQQGFAGEPSSGENPDYFPQSALAHSAWPAAAPAVAPIPAFSDESPAFDGHHPGGYVVLGQQW